MLDFFLNLQCIEKTEKLFLSGSDLHATEENDTEEIESVFDTAEINSTF